LVVAPGEDWIAAQVQGADNGVYVWDLATGRLLHARSDMGILALSPQGQLIVARGDDVVRWDPWTGRIVDTAGSGWLARGLVDRARRHVQRTWGKYISHIAVDPAGNWLARVDQLEQTRGGTVSQGATLRVQDRVRRTGHTLHMPGEVGSVVTGPDGAWLAVGTNGGYASGTVYLWRPGGEPRLLGEHAGPVTVGTSSGRGDWLATADRHGTVKLWPVEDTTTGREPALAQAMTVCHSSGRDWFACVDTDRTAYVVDTASGQVRHQLSSRERIRFVNQLVSTCVVAPDGRWLATADDDGTIYFWDPVTGMRTAVGVGHRHQVVAAGVAAHLLMTASFDGSVLVWSSSGGRPLYRFELGDGAIRLCRADPAGHWLAISGTDRLHLLVPDGSGAHEVARMPDPVTALDVNGSQLLVGDAAGGVHVVDPRDGRVRLVHRAPSPVRHLVSSPDQAWTACVAQQGDGTGTRIAFLRPEAAAPVAVIEKDVDPITACRPSPDGRMLATVSGRGTLRIWDVRHGRAVTGIRVAGGLYDVCWPGRAESVCAVGDSGVELFRLIAQPDD
jgi:WD40 repeat protein